VCRFCDTNSYKKIDDEKEKDVLKVIFFYDENDNRIDKNINRIIFYEEYKKGYYNHNNKCDANKNILLIQNKNNDIKEISSIINFIHSNKGLSLNNNKWFPKYIWVYN